jgi:hypothetical protein
MAIVIYDCHAFIVQATLTNILAYLYRAPVTKKLKHRPLVSGVYPLEVRSILVFSTRCFHGVKLICVSARRAFSGDLFSNFMFL